MKVEMHYPFIKKKLKTVLSSLKVLLWFEIGHLIGD